MTVRIDHQTRQRVVFDKHIGDMIYDADIRTAGSAVAQETVPVIGTWSDYTGSGIVPSNQQQQFAGQTNQLQGTTPQVESNAKLPVLNIVGDRAQTTRRRTRRIIKEINGTEMV